MIHPITKQELDSWYFRQPFDNVERITGVDIWNCPESDDIEDWDSWTVSRDEALDSARDIWDEMSDEEKLYWMEEIGNIY